MVNKILFFEDSSYSSFGGGQVVTEILIKYLLRKKINVMVFDYTDNSVFCEKIKSHGVRSIKLRFGLRRSNKGYGASQVPSVFKNFFLPFLMFFDLFKILPIVRHNKSAIFLSTTRFSHFFVFLIKIVFGRHWVAHVHSNEKNLFLRRMVRFVLKRADHVIFVSDYVSSLYKISLSSVLYNPVDLPSKTVERRAGSKLCFSFVGNLFEWKGINQFLDAAVIFLQTNGDVEFKVFGDGPKFNQLKASYPAVKFLGRVERDKLYSEFDVLVLPSVDAESCPMVVLESVVSGKVCITTNFGGQKELVDKFGGVLIKPNDIDDLLLAFRKIKAVFPLIGQKSNFTKEIFDSDKYGEKFLAMVQNETRG